MYDRDLRLLSPHMSTLGPAAQHHREVRLANGIGADTGPVLMTRPRCLLVQLMRPLVCVRVVVGRMCDHTGPAYIAGPMPGCG